jgi:phosphatidylinositol alpha-1,6-mannosyltransferase
VSVARHLLVTNDFPPKVGGIQSYLWELWHRLEPERYAVLTATSDPGAAGFDALWAERGIEIRRVPRSTLFFPTPRNRRVIEQTALEVGAELVVFDPAFPLGSLARRLALPSVQLLHGAEVAIPGRLPLSAGILRRALAGSAGAIAAGPYPEAEARRVAKSAMPPVLQLPPGVDTDRFVPLGTEGRQRARSHLGLSLEAPLVVSVSRLVPRKGMDTLIEASVRLRERHPQLSVLIGGTGRELERLEHLIRRKHAPVRLVGRVSDEELPELLGAADVFCLACRSRWGGLEQEGFGIVFLEAAAAGVPQVAGSSGGSADAVVDGVTGLVLNDPKDPDELADALDSLLVDRERAIQMGRAARERAEASFAYGVLARSLAEAFDQGWPMASSPTSSDKEVP